MGKHKVSGVVAANTFSAQTNAIASLAHVTLAHPGGSRLESANCTLALLAGTTKHSLGTGSSTAESNLTTTQGLKRNQAGGNINND